MNVEVQGVLSPRSDEVFAGSGGVLWRTGRALFSHAASYQCFQLLPLVEAMLSAPAE